MDLTVTREAGTDRKITQPGERHDPPYEWVHDGRENVLVVRSLPLARAVLRLQDSTRQSGFLGDHITMESAPILYQEGTQHREQRGATGRFFAPKVVSRDYGELIDAYVSEAIDRVRTERTVDVDDLSLSLAVAVAAKVVGLTSSSTRGMARRLDRFFEQDMDAATRSSASAWVHRARSLATMTAFFVADVRPAIRSRRLAPRADVISHLISKGYSDQAILTECLTYAAAGMATTREFISVATWHMLERPDVRAAYLAGDVAERRSILAEILRLEPVVGHLLRRTTREVVIEHGDETLVVPAGARIDVQVRSVNVDADLYGSDAGCLSASREVAPRTPRHGMSFGDGNHSCPGEHLAMEESDAFLQRLLALDIRVVRPPRVKLVEVIAAYELRGFTIAGTGRLWEPVAG